MAKTNAAEADEKHENGDAPLIDLNEAQLKKLIARAKKRGYITVDELNETVGDMTTDQIEDVMSAFSEMGINVVENEEADEDEPEAAAGDADAGPAGGPAGGPGGGGGGGGAGPGAAEAGADAGLDDGSDGGDGSERFVVEKKKETVDRT